MDQLSTSLVIVFAAIAIIPLFSRRTGLPVIVAEIIIGILLGKSMLNIIPGHPIIDFFSSFGLVYLMFLAGVEVNFEHVRRFFSHTISITLLSLSLPFLAGFFLAPYAGVNPLFFGAVFSTTSLGIVLPLTREFRNIPNFSHVLLGSAVLVDIISMFILAFSLSAIKGELQFSFVYSLLVILILFLIPWFINNRDVKNRIRHWEADKSHFEIEVRAAFALILIFAAISEELGFHSIIGAFIAGLVISELTFKASMLEKKLEGFGYGFFIPLFFIFMGAKVDIPSLFSNLGSIYLMVVIICLAMVSKLVGVSIISRINGFATNESLALGMFHSARFSLVIAAVEIGSGLGIVDSSMFSIFVILAIASSTTGPTLGKRLLGHRKASDLS